MEQRDYQSRAVEETIRLWQNGTTAVLAVMPTGCGKTVVSSNVARRVKEIRRSTGKTLYLAHRYELIGQAMRTLKKMGLSVAVEMGGERAKPRGLWDVCVATVQSLKGDRLSDWDGDTFDAIITDECHRARAKSYQRVFQHFGSAWQYGTTATPGRGDKKSLGTVYRATAINYPILDAIRDGWLVPIRPDKIKTPFDLNTINTTRGENRGLNLGDLAERIGPRLHDLCGNIVDGAGSRQTIVFAPDLGSAQATAQVLRDYCGVTAKYVAGSAGPYGMKREERKSVEREFTRLDVQYLVNCDLYEEGYDCPSIECVVNMRPTFSRFKYMQRVGRGTRPCHEIGKSDCLVLDFDWKADDESRELCSHVDLVDDGSLDFDVISEVRSLLKTRTYDDIRDAIRDAEAAIRRRSYVDVRLPPSRIPKKFERWTHDPSGVSKILGVTLKARYDFDKTGANPASESQVGWLSRAGVQDAGKLSKWGASKLISAIKKRQDSGLCSFQDAHALMAAGMPEKFALSQSPESASRALRNSAEAVPA